MWLQLKKKKCKFQLDEYTDKLPNIAKISTLMSHNLFEIKIPRKSVFKIPCDVTNYVYPDRRLVRSDWLIHKSPFTLKVWDYWEIKIFSPCALWEMIEFCQSYLQFLVHENYAQSSGFSCGLLFSHKRIASVTIVLHGKPWQSTTASDRKKSKPVSEGAHLMSDDSFTTSKLFTGGERFKPFCDVNKESANCNFSLPKAKLKVQ